MTKPGAIKRACASVLAAALASCSAHAAAVIPSTSSVYHVPDISPNDWPEYRRDDQRSGANADQSTIKKANIATLAPKWTFQTNHGAFATPVVVSGRVYVADLGGNVYGLDESSGALRWTYFDGGTNIVATPTYANGELYAGTDPGADGGPQFPGSFLALDAATGALVRTYTPTGQNGGYESSPIVAEGSVFEGLTDVTELPSACITGDQLIAFDPSSAAIQRTLTLTPPGITGESVWSSPLLDPSGGLYIATSNACTSQSSQYAVSIINLDPGSLRIVWAVQPHPDINDLDFGSTPMYVDGLIIEGGKDGFVWALNASSGAIVWKSDGGFASASIIGSPGTDGKRIYVPFAVAGNGGAVVALNLDGSVAWSLATSLDPNHYGVLSAPAVSGGMVFVGYADAGCPTCYGISALDADTGSVLWRYKTAHPIYSGPSIVNGGLFVAEFEGDGFYCFTPDGK